MQETEISGEISTKMLKALPVKAFEKWLRIRYKQLILQIKDMVEAGGVEPPSENIPLKPLHT
jgi:hypothetical protein